MAKKQTEIELPHPEALGARDLWVLPALLVIAFIALAPAMLAPVNYAPGLPGMDARSQWYPWRVYGFGEMLKGNVPLWNPYVLCGTPFLGNFQSALFYPPNLLFAFFSIATAVKASVLLHLWLSMIFTYALCRMFCRNRAAAMAGAIIFSLCAEQLLRVTAGHWGVSCAIPWMPLTLLAVEGIMRRPRASMIILGAAAIAMQVLSGIPQMAFITAVLACSYAIMRAFGEGFSWSEKFRRWGVVVVMYFMGAAIAAPQLLPGMEAAMSGARSLHMRPAWVNSFALGPENVATLLLPGFFGGTSQSAYWGRCYYWEMNIYVGVGTLALGLAGMVLTRPKRRAIILGILAGFMLLLALGRHTPLMDVLILMPFADMLRGSSKFALAFSLPVAILAAKGLEETVKPGQARDLLIALGVVALAATALALADCTWLTQWQSDIYKTQECLYSINDPANAAQPGPAIISAITSLAILGGMAAALILFRRKPRALATALVLLVAADGIAFARSFIGPWATFPIEGSSWPAGAGQALRDLGPMYRSVAVANPMINDAILERVKIVEGIEPNPPARFHKLIRMAQGEWWDIAPSLYFLTEFNSIEFRMGLKYAMFQGPPTDMDTSNVVSKGADWHVRQTKEAVPRVRVTYDSLVAPNPDSALDYMGSPDAPGPAVLEKKTTPPADGTPATATSAAITTDEPDRVVVKAELEKPGFVVLLDNFSPGWRATVNGKPVEILHSDYAFRAVAVSPGAHEIVFSYLPRTLLWGCIACAAAILICIALGMFSKRIFGA